MARSCRRGLRVDQHREWDCEHCGARNMAKAKACWDCDRSRPELAPQGTPPPAVPMAMPIPAAEVGVELENVATLRAEARAAV